MHHREKNVLAFVRSLGVFLTELITPVHSLLLGTFSDAVVDVVSWVLWSSRRTTLLRRLFLPKTDPLLILSPATVHVALLTIFEAVVVVLFADTPSWEHFKIWKHAENERKIEMADASLLYPVSHCAPGIVFPLVAYAHKNQRNHKSNCLCNKERDLAGFLFGWSTTGLWSFQFLQLTKPWPRIR